MSVDWIKLQFIFLLEINIIEKTVQSNKSSNFNRIKIKLYFGWFIISLPSFQFRGGFKKSVEFSTIFFAQNGLKTVFRPYFFYFPHLLSKSVCTIILPTVHILRSAHFRTIFQPFKFNTLLLITHVIIFPSNICKLK